ncbi:MAG: sugar phosphate nucleotidyltransferase [Candidatus Omnitrophota bacterium]
MMPIVVILAGGAATRLYPVTQTIPKAMLELAGKPFIAHQMDLLQHNGVTRVVICAGYLGEQLKNYVKDGRKFKMKVDFSFDGKKLLGTAGAIKKTLPLLEDNFAVMYGDSYLTENFNPIADFFFLSNKKGLMAVFKNDKQRDASNVAYAEGKVIKYDKKNLAAEMKHIDYGLSFFKKEAFAEITENQVYNLADLCKNLAEEDQLAGYEVKRRFYEIGSSKGLDETRSYLEKLRRKS